MEALPRGASARPISAACHSGANERLIVGRLEQNLRRFHTSLDAALG